jgi:hypothetical protein
VLSLQSRIQKIKFKDNGAPYSKSKLPPALQVCQDSRSIEGPRHIHCFRTDPDLPPRTCVNFTLDTIYLTSPDAGKNHALLATMDAFHRDQIQTMAFHISYQKTPGFGAVQKEVESMPQLEYLTILLDGRRFFRRATWYGDTNKGEFRIHPDELSLKDTWHRR